jgi:2'-5' RNA ligase
MIRAFLAVELTEDLRTRLARVQQDLKQRLGHDLTKAVRMSWVQTSSIHLTIKFLGDIDEALVEPMRESLDAVVQGHRPVQVPLDRLGAFPHAGQPRVLWVGAPEQWERGEDATRLAALHRAVEDCCESFGCARDERPLSPHLTLARVKEGERHLGQVLAKSGVMDRPLSVGALRVESVVLMKSELRPAGPVYTKLWEVGQGRRG